jgi:fucose permease
MILGLVGAFDASGGTAGPSFTIIKSDGIAAAEYEVVSSTQSALTVTINFGGSAGWLMFGDAVQAAPPPIPEYPIGLPVLAIFMIVTYSLIRRRTKTPKNI